ncbi:MAG: hypothetical protein REH83_07090 [Rickettsiella sp.]|nr:hypothetical protein [Rickettsiella sp.]
MDKKNYNLNEDDEYQFQELKSSTNFSEANSASTGGESPAILERIKRQHIFLGFIFIFLIFGAYKLLNSFFHVIISKEQAMEKIQKTVPKIDNNSTNNVNVKPDLTMGRLDRLEQGQLRVQSELQSLDSQLSGIQTTLTNLSTQLTQINDDVQSLHASQETLIKNQTKPVKTITLKKKEVPKPIYFVRAIIPGRVWLTTQDGSTLTLGVGDKLAGYGLVDAINPDQGTVILNSGAVIGYSPNDR